MAPMNDEALKREALRVFSRYQVEVVEHFRLCPWADRSRRAGRTRPIVLPLASTDLAPALAAIAELANDPAIEVGFLLFPRLDVDALTFERAVSALTRQDAARWKGAPPFAMAAFHPDAPPDLSNAERLIPFIRRTPDPTVQLVRLESLERVRAGEREGTQLVDIELLCQKNLTASDTRPLRERIARANLDAITRAGLDRVTNLLEDIRRDRQEAYARIALPTHGSAAP
jgi:hypothetical protein